MYLQLREREEEKKMEGKVIFNYIIAKIFQNQSQQATDSRTFQT